IVLVLSPIPVSLMLLYPFTKRFTSACHLVLGASLGLAPVGAWVAVRNTAGMPIARRILLSPDHWPRQSFQEYGVGWAMLAELAPWLLGAAVMFWVAGFDVIYALQDDAFDREQNLHSIPAALGRTKALWASRLMHSVSAALFFAFIYVLTHPAPLRNGMDVTQYTEVAKWVWAAPCVMLLGIVYQHSLVKPNDLSRVNVAFFTVNGVISVIFGAIFVAAWLLA
ncbi:MAG: UbiA family prenyltransferase, partial [Planctomycetes bacterium]|nr:UbiA family prenyltransferase [Planctomycetota bacterium]